MSATNPYDDPREVQRAREYQASLARREQARKERLRALRGSRTARRALADAWAAVRREPWRPGGGL